MPIDIGQLKQVTPTPPPKRPELKPEQMKAQKERSKLEEERVYRKGVVTVKDLIAPASFRITPKTLELSGTYLRTIFAITYPRHIGLGWSAPILNLNKTLDIAMFFYPMEAQVVLKQLRKKVGVLEATIMSAADKGAPRNPADETALRDAESLRDAITQGIEHFFQFAFYITIYADSEESLERQTNEIQTLLGSKLIYSKSGFYQAEQGFNSTIPLGNDELMITYNMNTSPIAASFPFISADLSSDDGILYGINRHNNSLILYDRCGLQNANFVVFATSGAGKSYAIKLEILRSLMMGIDVIVIDPEMEYKHLSDAVGGTYINISLASEAKVNPFDLPRKMSDDTKTEDLIRSAVITLKGLLRIMIGEPIGEKGSLGFSPEEDSLLDRALIETYAKKDITGDVTNLEGIEPPTFQDFQDVLEGMEGGENVVARLKKYTEGTFSGLLNSPTTVEMKNQLVIFSVRDLEDELRPVGIYSIVNYIWNVVRSERKKRILVIDEAWWLMQQEDSAKFVFALVKRCRKYWLGVTTITQDVNDFLRSPYGQAIVTNSAIQLLMKQSSASVDLVQNTFNLTDGEKYLLLESGVGEGIFFAGDKHAAIKVVASYTEDQIVTTNPQQLLEIEAAKKEFEAELEAELAGQKDNTPIPLEPEVEVTPEEMGEGVSDVQAKEQSPEDAAAALLSAEEEGKEEADRIRKSLSV